MLRELTKLRGSLAPAMPVVMTSLAGHPPQYEETELGAPVYGISQTPQVSLDFQVFEKPDGLTFNWDFLPAVYPDGLIDAMFEEFTGLLEALGEDEVWERHSPPPGEESAAPGKAEERDTGDAGVQGQSAFHLIRRAALAGRICHGPQRGGDATFVLLDDWLPATGPVPFAGAAAERELARRYRTAYGPSDALDFVHWSGLKATTGKNAWAAVRDTGPEPVPSPAEPDVRLLPAYDNYLVGYRSRDLSVPAEHERRVWPGGGQIRATVLVDGLAVGTWSGGRRGTPVTVEPFPGTEPHSPAVAAGIARESADIARFSSGTHRLSTSGL
ncbi:hypothetical protein SAVIM40S_07078 [Streptomyces avidinii]